MAVTPEGLYASVAEEFLGVPGVTQPADATGRTARFGASALKVDNKILEMAAGGKLVVKLPRRRVDAMIALAPSSEDSWRRLARETMDFARSRR